MNTTSTDLDDQIEALTGQMAAGLDKLAAGSFIREGIVKQAISSLVWDLYATMPDQRDALIEALHGWEHPIRDAEKKDALEKEAAPTD